MNCMLLIFSAVFPQHCIFPLTFFIALLVHSILFPYFHPVITFTQFLPLSFETWSHDLRLPSGLLCSLLPLLPSAEFTVCTTTAPLCTAGDQTQGLVLARQTLTNRTSFVNSLLDNVLISLFCLSKLPNSSLMVVCLLFSLLIFFMSLLSVSLCCSVRVRTEHTYTL